MAQEIYPDDIMKERKRTYEQANGQIDIFGMVRRNAEVLNGRKNRKKNFNNYPSEQASKVARLNELDSVHASIAQLAQNNKAICNNLDGLKVSSRFFSGENF